MRHHTSIAARLVVAAAAVLALASCSAGTDDPSDDATSAAPFVAPGWMAEQAQANEDLVAHQQACLTERGISFTVDKTGMYTFAGDDPATANQALTECTKEFLGDLYGAAPTPDQLREMYTRALDVRLCLINEGFDIDEPISEEAYVDSGGRWSAYEGVGSASQERLAELYKTCPEPDLTTL
ncbi:hypothetical protein ACFO3K_01855 [Cellulomonas algicola]|uniref:hypothetical protein n=1 Tax=Cellulomonas algicola TaxID=2071633 RepID=UPI001C3F61F6|nr:hypothetical protein [Cellulomonas algicola]